MKCAYLDKITINTKKLNVGDCVSFDGIEITYRKGDTARQFADKIRKYIDVEIEIITKE